MKLMNLYKNESHKKKWKRKKRDGRIMNNTRTAGVCEDVVENRVTIVLDEDDK